MSPYAALLGTTFITVGLVKGWQSWLAHGRCERVAGKIMEIRKEWDTDGDPVYRPVVHFRAPSGRSVEFKGKVGGGPNSRHVGEIVRVAYEREAPEDARIDEILSWWRTPSWLLVFGTICFVLPLSKG
jgi:hypothetical protein